MEKTISKLKELKEESTAYYNINRFKKLIDNADDKSTLQNIKKRITQLVDDDELSLKDGETIMLYLNKKQNKNG